VIINNRLIIAAALSGLLLASYAANAGQTASETPVPSHADAAVVFAKYSGLFERYVPDTASLNECVSFLNETGIYFGLLEVVNGSDFTPADCARVMGQLSLLFSGEAEYVGGKIKLPAGIDSWMDFCILNDVKYVEGYGNLVSTVAVLRDLSG
jgi:hypothetical protein